jgi:hypothetical protein
MQNTDLDIDSPDKVSNILRSTADVYRESATELESAWQDKHAGKAWIEIAAILDRAADSIDEIDMP